MFLKKDYIDNNNMNTKYNMDDDDIISSNYYDISYITEYISYILMSIEFI